MFSQVKNKNPSLLENTNWFSYFTYGYFTPTLRAGHSKPLQKEDLPSVSSRDDPEIQGDILVQKWREIVTRKGGSEHTTKWDLFFLLLRYDFPFFYVPMIPLLLYL